MPGLLSLAYRNLTSKRLRTFLTLLAIALGTGVITATFSTNRAIEGSLEQTAVSIAGKADLIVEAVDTQGFGDEAVAALRNHPAVQLVAPRVQKRTFVRTLQRVSFRTPSQQASVQLLGINPAAGLQAQTVRLVAGDFLPEQPSRVVLAEEAWASRLGIKLGDTIDLLTKEGFVSFQVGGLAADVSSTEVGVGGILYLHLEVAQSAFGLQGSSGFAELVGIDPVAELQLHSYRLVSGEFLAAGGSHSVLVEEAWATPLDVRVGDALNLLTREGFVQFRVVGILAEAHPGQAGTGGVLRLHLATAQSLFGLEGRIQRLSIKVQDQSQVDELERQLPGLLRRDFIARRVSLIAQELQDSVADFQLLLGFFGGIALFVGAFLVYNTLSMTVVEQTREIGLLRAVGASMNQITTMTLAQGMILGAAGTVPGILLGQLLAFLLVGWLEATQQLTSGAQPLSLSGILLGAGMGLIMTLLAALLPAWRAGRLSPLAALGVAAAPRERREHRVRRTLAMVGLMGLVVFLLWPVAEETRGLKALSLLPLFLLLVYLSPTYVDPLVWLGGAPFRRWSTGLGVMAQRNVQREKGRTGLTVAGFFVSLALIVALTNVANSAATAGQQWVQSLFPGEYVVVSPVPQPQLLMSEFSGVPGVEQVSAVVMQPVTWNGIRLTAAGVDSRHYLGAFQFTEGEQIRNTAYVALRRGNAVLVPARLARAWGLQVGDSMPLRIGETETPFTVSGIIAHSLPTVDNFGALVLSSSDLQRYSGADDFQFLAVTIESNRDPAQVLLQLRKVAEQYGMEANSVQNLKLSVHQAVQRLLVLFVGLVVTGILVGSLGIVNTMLMSVAQRTRELGVLRAEGMTQGQVQLLTMTEAAILGFVGAFMGIAAGGFLTWVMVELSRTPDFDPQFSFSPLIAFLSLALGILAAVIAALYPARRAAGINIVAAVQHE